MKIEVHFGGHFLIVQGSKQYVGGCCKEIEDFDTDKMSWFELRYMLKSFGVISDFRVHCLRPRESLDSGLEAVFSDKCIMRILNYLDKEQNIVLYIEHLVPGSDKEKLPDYCLPGKDDPINVVPAVVVGGLNGVEGGVQTQTTTTQRFKKVCAHKPPRVVRRSPRTVRPKNPEFMPPSAAPSPRTTPMKSPNYSSVSVSGIPSTTTPILGKTTPISRTAAARDSPGTAAPSPRTTPMKSPMNSSVSFSGIPSTTTPVSGKTTPTSRTTAARDSPGTAAPSPRITPMKSPMNSLVSVSDIPSTTTPVSGKTTPISRTAAARDSPGIAAPSPRTTPMKSPMNSSVSVSGIPSTTTPVSRKTTPTSRTTVARDSPRTATKTPKRTPRKSPVRGESTPTSTPRKGPTSVASTPITPTSTAQTTPPSVSPTNVPCAFVRRSPRLNKWSTDDSWRQFMQFVEEEFTESIDHVENANTNKNSGKASENPQGNINFDGDSEYQPSGSLHSDSPLQDEGFTSIPRYPQFREDRDMNNDDDFCFEVGMQFQSPDEFRKAIRHHAIVKGFDLFWQKNEGVRISVKCKAEGCPFRLYCSWNSDMTKYVVKSFVSKHSCARPLRNTQLTKRWIARKYLEHYRSDPNLKWQLLKDMVQRDVGISIGQHTCYRVRNIALEEIQGRHNDQYEKLWDYAHVLLKYNQGSYVKVKTRPIPNDTNHVLFEAFFVSYAAMIKGMLSGCRPVLGIDGCHLKSSNGGILLSAVSRDPNNQMYPVAYAVVEVENKDTWSWFITCLLEALGVHNVQGWTFICDRQKGLVESLKLLVPRADVRFCARHLYANFKEKFKGLMLKRLLWKAAAAYTVEGHLDAMKEIKDIRMEAFTYLDGIDKHLWARSYFSHSSKCDMLVNNICESFNKFILEARDKPILTMLEMLRRQLMTRFVKKRQSSEKITLFGTKIIEKLKEMEKGSRHCTPYPAAPDLFQVVEKENQVVVHMKNQTCSCNQWQLTGIPCRHAICCIQYLRNMPEDYVHEFYSKERYIAAYREIIYPIPDQSTWEKQNLLKIKPPKYKKQPGRPKKVRKKEADEVKGKQKLPRTGQGKTCSKCKELGHNSRGCKSAEVITASNVSIGRKRGRPRITPIEAGECSTGKKRGRKRATPTEGGESSQQGSSITAMRV